MSINLSDKFFQHWCFSSCVSTHQRTCKASTQKHQGKTLIKLSVSCSMCSTCIQVHLNLYSRPHAPPPIPLLRGQPLFWPLFNSHLYYAARPVSCHPKGDLFCFIPLSNGQEDLKLDVFNQIKVKEWQCGIL